MKAYEGIAAELQHQDVRTMFGLIGVSNLPYIASFCESYGGEFIGAVRESGAVSMADGYGRASGTVAIASVTHGPGLTNTITSLVEAARAGTAMVLLASDTPTRERHHRQWIDISSAVACTGAGYVRSTHSDRLADDLGRAIYAASVDRRPIVLDIPVGLLNAEVEYVPSSYRAVEQGCLSPDPDLLDEALGIIASARRPLIIAGRGAAQSRAQAEIFQLADLCGAAVATTVQGRDFFAGHPRNLGICGTLSDEVATEIILQADCVIAFGAGLNEKTTASGSLIKGKPVIQCDIERSNLNLYAHAQVSIEADARVTAAAMVEALTSSGAVKSGDGVIEDRLATRKAPSARADKPSGRLDMLTGFAAFDKIIPGDRAVVTDSGRFLAAAWSGLHVEDPAQIYGTHNFGSIGLGVPTAIGVAAARRDSVTVAVAGDGGGMMGLQEFTTAVQHRLPLVVLVANDGYYGAERDKLMDLGFDDKYAITQWPDFATLAKALGGGGVTVDSVVDIENLDADRWRIENLPLIVDMVSETNM